MTNLVCFTELILNGNILIIYMLICQNFGVSYQITSKHSTGNENCKKAYKKVHIQSNELENVCTITL